MLSCWACVPHHGGTMAPLSLMGQEGTSLLLCADPLCWHQGFLLSAGAGALYGAGGGRGHPGVQPWCPSAVSGLQVMFSEEALPKGKGEYILGYYSNTSSSIAGVTEPFQVSMAKGQG